MFGCGNPVDLRHDIKTISLVKFFQCECVYRLTRRYCWLQQRLCKSKSRSLSDGESCFGEDFAQAFLRAHNEYRTRHGVQPLKLSKKVAPESPYRLPLDHVHVQQAEVGADEGSSLCCS